MPRAMVKYSMSDLIPRDEKRYSTMLIFMMVRHGHALQLSRRRHGGKQEGYL